MYRKIEGRIWTDPKFRSMSRDAQWLFLYLVTNNHSHVSGLYYLSPAMVDDEAGIDRDRFAVLMAELGSAQIAQYDTDRRVVWVVNMYRHQGRGPKLDASVVNHFKDLHGSPLIGDFLKRYPIKDLDSESFKVSGEARYSIDTLSILPTRARVPSPSPSPVPDPSPEGEEGPGEGDDDPPDDPPAEVAAALPPKPGPAPGEFLAAWNEAVPFSVVRVMGAERVKALAARRADPFWLGNWAVALSRIKSTPFLRGENDRNWKATIDWFLRPGTAVKVLEGAYDGQPQRTSDRDIGRARAEPGKYDEANLPLYRRRAGAETSGAG